MTRRLNLYIARRFFVTVTIILSAVGLIAFLAEFLEVLRRHADETEFTALLGLQISFMRVLILLDGLLPFAFLFGAVISLIDLSRKSELVVARASGVSVWGFLRGPVVVAVLVGAASTALLNPAAVIMKQRAIGIEADLVGKAPKIEGFWFRQSAASASSIVNAGSASSDGNSLIGVTAFVFDADGGFREKVTAARAEFAGDHWALNDAKVLSASGAQTPVAAYELPTQLRAGELRRSVIAPDSVFLWSLPGFIETAKRTGEDPSGFRVAFHTLLNRPLMLLAMVLIAASVSLRLTRHGGAWGLVLTGATAGFLLYAFSEIVNDLGSNGIIDPVLAAWLPSSVALMLGATALLYQEDG